MENLKAPLQALDEVIESFESALGTSKAEPIAQSVAKDKQNGQDGVNKAQDAGPQADSDTTNAQQPEKEKKKKGPKPAAKPKLPDESLQFNMCDLRVGLIREVGFHPEADGLYVLKIDVGAGETRTVCAGLRKYVPEAEMQERRVVLICNLKPRKLRGVDSEAMCLAGSVVGNEGDKETVVPIAPPAAAEPGAILHVDGIEGERTVEDGKYVSSKNWDRVVGRFAVKNGQACYDGKPMLVSGEAVSCDLPDGAEIH